MSSACKEWLLREIMRVYACTWEEALAKVDVMNRQNDEGAWLVTGKLERTGLGLVWFGLAWWFVCYLWKGVARVDVCIVKPESNEALIHHARIHTLNSQQPPPLNSTTAPYKVGVAAGILSALASIPLVFDLQTVLWFNESFVHQTCPRGASWSSTPFGRSAPSPGPTWSPCWAA